MPNLKHDIEQAKQSMTRKESAKFSIKLQPYFRTLPETISESIKIADSLKAYVITHGMY